MTNPYLAAGIAGLLAFLLAYIPAPLLYQWSRDSWGPQSQAAGLSGTLWQGQAAAVSLSGIVLRDVRWQWRPQSLLLGRISHRVQAETSAGAIEAVVSSSLLGSTLRVTALNGALPLEQLGTGLQLPVLPFSGRMQLAIQKLQLRQGRPWSAEGGVHINDMMFSFASPPVTLGSYHAVLTTAAESIQLELSSQGGQLEAKGTGQVTREGQYEVDMLLRPRASAPPAVVNLLQTLGQANAEGWYRFRHSGAL